jgi:hypothetical protein
MRFSAKSPSFLIGALALAALLIALTVTGCGNEGTVPTASEGTTADPLAFEGPDPSPSPRGHEAEPKFIKSGETGDLKLDRWTLTIEKDAMRDKADITMENASAKYVMVELGPDGLEFDKPVKLEVDLSGLKWDPHTDWTMWWFNEERGCWEDMGGTFDPETEVLTVYIDHFSTWGPGRAGW